MDSLIFFLHILAWPIAVIATLMAGVAMYLAAKYPGSFEETLDRLNGQQRTFYHWRLIFIAFVAWAFIIAF